MYSFSGDEIFSGSQPHKSAKSLHFPYFEPPLPPSVVASPQGTGGEKSNGGL